MGGARGWSLAGSGASGGRAWRGALERVLRLLLVVEVDCRRGLRHFSSALATWRTVVPRASETASNLTRDRQDSAVIPSPLRSALGLSLAQNNAFD